MGRAGSGRRGPSRLGTTEQEARERLAGVAEGLSRTGMSEDRLAALCRPSWRPMSGACRHRPRERLRRWRRGRRPGPRLLFHLALHGVEGEAKRRQDPRTVLAQGPGPSRRAGRMEPTEFLGQLWTSTGRGMEIRVVARPRRPDGHVGHRRPRCEGTSQPPSAVQSPLLWGCGRGAGNTLWLGLEVTSSFLCSFIRMNNWAGLIRLHVSKTPILFKGGKKRKSDLHNSNAEAGSGLALGKAGSRAPGIETGPSLLSCHWSLFSVLSGAASSSRPTRAS